MRWLAVLACSAALTGGAATAAAQASPVKPAPSAASKAAPVHVEVPIPAAVREKSLLPAAFDGWVAAHPPAIVTDPAQADSANAAALKEYGFDDAVMATYSRDGDTLTVHALRFDDLTGAFGAYSFYRKNGWPIVDVGTGGASDYNRVVFWTGSTVVDATFSRVGPMSAGELRNLARRLPVPLGNKALAPPVLAYLPKTSLQKGTMHYALGPVGYSAEGVLPAGLIGFNMDAEVVTASYALISGPAVLTIINYPTPQMAKAQEARIRDYLKAGANAQPPRTQALVDSNQTALEVRRSGPLVVVVSGDAIQSESHRLIEMVHYDPNLTAIPGGTRESDVSKTGQFLLGIATLILIGSVAAILLGLFLGGGRALYRIARGKPASSVYETEFIRLNLRK